MKLDTNLQTSEERLKYIEEYLANNPTPNETELDWIANYLTYPLDKEERLNLYFHKKLMNDEIPLSVGGGIGQSRLCMVLLHKAHVGEIQASIWPEEMREECAKAGMPLI